MTKQHEESLAAFSLREKGYAVFLPMLRLPPAKDGVVTRQALFLRYLFVQLAVIMRARPVREGKSTTFPEVLDSSWGGITNARGVRHLVTMGGLPVPVPGVELEKIKAKCDADGNVVAAVKAPPAKHRITKGMECRILRGPFVNFTALCEMAAPDRVDLLMSILGGAHTLSFNPRDVEAA